MKTSSRLAWTAQHRPSHHRRVIPVQSRPRMGGCGRFAAVNHRDRTVRLCGRDSDRGAGAGTGAVPVRSWRHPDDRRVVAERDGLPGWLGSSSTSDSARGVAVVFHPAESISTSSMMAAAGDILGCRFGPALAVGVVSAPSSITLTRKPPGIEIRVTVTVPPGRPELMYCTDGSDPVAAALREELR